MSRTAMFLLGAAGLLTSSVASASSVVLDFDGIVGDPAVLFHSVEDYYDGGFSSGRFSDPPAGPGPDYGVVFEGGGLADSIGAGALSGDSVLLITFVFATPPISMDVESGFTALSFFYQGEAISISVFDDFDGTGNQLGSVDLAAETNWTLAVVPVSGVARSVVWGDSFPSGTRFDDVSLNLVPEPGSAVLLGAGLVAIAARRGRRRGDSG